MTVPSDILIRIFEEGLKLDDGAWDNHLWFSDDKRGEIRLYWSRLMLTDVGVTLPLTVLVSGATSKSRQPSHCRILTCF